MKRILAICAITIIAILCVFDLASCSLPVQPTTITDTISWHAVVTEWNQTPIVLHNGVGYVVMGDATSAFTRLSTAVVDVQGTADFVHHTLAVNHFKVDSVAGNPVWDGKLNHYTRLPICPYPTGPCIFGGPVYYVTTQDLMPHELKYPAPGLIVLENHRVYVDTLYSGTIYGFIQ